MTRPSAASRAGLGALLSCVLLLPLLSGCALYNRVFHRRHDATCREHPFIGNTDSRPPLQVPEGMSAPDTRNAIKIPQLPPPPPELAKSEPCLAQPPPFYSKPPAARPGSPTPAAQPSQLTKPAPPDAPAPPTAPASPTTPAPPATPPAAPGAAAPGG